MMDVLLHSKLREPWNPLALFNASGARLWGTVISQCPAYERALSPGIMRRSLSSQKLLILWEGDRWSKSCPVADDDCSRSRLGQFGGCVP